MKWRVNLPEVSWTPVRHLLNVTTHQKGFVLADYFIRNTCAPVCSCNYPIGLSMVWQWYRARRHTDAGGEQRSIWGHESRKSEPALRGELQTEEMQPVLMNLMNHLLIRGQHHVLMEPPLLLCLTPHDWLQSSYMWTAARSVYTRECVEVSEVRDCFLTSVSAPSHNT